MSKSEILAVSDLFWFKKSSFVALGHRGVPLVKLCAHLDERLTRMEPDYTRVGGDEDSKGVQGGVATVG